MRKPFMLTSAFLMLLNLGSCVDDVDSNRSDGMFSAAQSGLNALNAYDLGSLNEVELAVAKAGLKDVGGTITFSVEENLLDSLNAANGTNYQLLPADCYTLENTTYAVGTGGDRYVTGGKLIYDPHKIYALAGFENTKYALPFRVKSDGTPMNPDRTSVLYTFNIKEAIVNLTSSGGDFTVVDGAVKDPMTLNTKVGFANQWDLTTTFAAKNEEYVENYNASNETFFKLLPGSAFTIADATIIKGKDSGSSTVELDGKALAPGNYLLPVFINGLSGQGEASISYDPEEVTVFRISKLGAAIDRSNWKITASTEEKTGEGAGNGCAVQMIDGNINSFWHSQWSGGEVAPPYEIKLDMGKVNDVSQLGLVARQNALTKMNLEIYAGNDGTNWELIGKFYFDGNIKTEQSVAVKACEARYIRLYIPSLDGSGVGHLAELYVYGTDK